MPDSGLPASYHLSLVVPNCPTVPAYGAPPSGAPSLPLTCTPTTTPLGQAACTEGSAEDHVALLIEETNRTHIDHATSGWTYELTTEVANIGIVVSETAQTLLVNPCWLRFVVSSGDFKACVADEIVAWYLIRQFISSGIGPGVL